MHLPFTGIHLPQSRLQLHEFLLSQFTSRILELAHIFLFLQEIPVHLFEAALSVVIGDDPGKDEVLGKIISGASRVSIDQSQIFEVAELSSLPPLSKPSSSKLIGSALDHLCFR